MSRIITWIALHSGGWEMILPFVLLSAGVGTWLVRSGRRSMVPLAVVPGWAISLVLYYRSMQIDRFWYFDRTRWFALSGSLALLLVIPFAIVTTLLLLDRVGRLRPLVAGSIGALGGLVGIPLAGAISGILGHIILPLLSGR